MKVIPTLIMGILAVIAQVYLYYLVIAKYKANSRDANVGFTLILYSSFVIAVFWTIAFGLSLELEKRDSPCPQYEQIQSPVYKLKEK